MLPVGFHADGKPVGMMLVGSALDDSKLIRAIYAIEHCLGRLLGPDLRQWK